MKNLKRSNQRQELAAAGLTPKQARCLALHCFDGLTRDEMGLRLRINQRAAAYNIVAARGRLAEVGLKATMPESDFQPVVYPMDPLMIDRLGPNELKAVW